jgi:hypothetical protein
VFDGTGVLADVILSMLASYLTGCLVKVDKTLEHYKNLTTMAIGESNSYAGTHACARDYWEAYTLTDAADNSQATAQSMHLIDCSSLATTVHSALSSWASNGDA